MITLEKICYQVKEVVVITPQGKLNSFEWKLHFALQLFLGASPTLRGTIFLEQAEPPAGGQLDRFQELAGGSGLALADGLGTL